MLLWVWYGEALHRQSRVLSTFKVVLLTGAALALWLLAFSRLRPALRLGIFVCGLVPVLILAATVRYRGVSGDLVPVLEWRWSSRSASAPPQPPADAPGAFDVDAPTFPRLRGADGRGAVAGVELDPDWERRPPRVLWRRPVGPGWSGFVLQGGLAVTQEQRDDEECVSALAIGDGAPRWSYCRAGRFEDPLGGPGPRATPTLAEGKVYALGGRGRLAVLALDSGRLLWERDVLADHGAAVPEYGVAASPLVRDGTVYVVVGGNGTAIAAYDAESGAPRWAGGSAAAAYSSPIWVELAGRPQVVALMDERVLAVDPADGERLWQHDWPASTQFIAQPLPMSGDRLLLSAGYGAGARMLRVERAEGDGLVAKLLWESAALKAKMSSFVERDGRVYGLDDGRLACLDPADGSRVWKGSRYGHGELLLVDELLLIQAENGDVVLAAADPAGHRELARTAALDRKTWNHPALAGSLLLVRNDREAVAMELPLR